MSGVVAFDLTKKVQSSLLGMISVSKCHDPSAATFSSHINNNNCGLKDTSTGYSSRDAEVDDW